MIEIRGIFSLILSQWRSALCAALIVSLVCQIAPAAAWADPVEEMPVLARVGPWPVVSHMIGFQGRLWFVNSVKGRNHNSADLHSYDPRSGSLRYERHLFSQDAGQPLVSEGLLYWPFEDSRASLGWGEYMVTDGTHWQLGTIPTAQIFHSHAMARLGPDIVAATSAWRAGLQVSRDGGATWRPIYDHPTDEGRVTRIVALAATGPAVFARLIDRGKHRLLRFDGQRTEPVPGWPQDRPIVDMTAFGDQVYGLVRESGGVTVWRSDGRTSVRIFTPAEPWDARDIAAGIGGLWVISAESGSGTLWHGLDGADLRPVARLRHGQPHQVALYAGKIYVGGAATDGRGILWGPGPPAPTEAPSVPAALPRRPATALDLAKLGDSLDRALATPESYVQHGADLRNLVYRAVGAHAPREFFETRLSATMPRHKLSMIGGDVRVSADRFGRWILLWGMAVGGQGRVPLDLVLASWTAEANRSQKYFDATPMAIWAVANLRQRDRATLTALIARVAQAGDPTWLKGDVVGALSALTGERFGYNAPAWRAWWDDAAQTWPE